MSNQQQRLENLLWTAMDRIQRLAGPRDSMHYFAGLLFLKYLSDRRDTGTAFGRLPPEVQWDQIRDSVRPCEELVRAMDAIRFHPDYHEIGDQLDALGLPELAGKSDLCRELIEIVSSIDLSSIEGQLLEGFNAKLLERWVEASGVRSGEFYTPSNLSLLIAELLAPEAGATIYDPTAGTGSLLLAAYQQSMKEVSGDSDAHVLGQEINLQTAALAKVNLILSGLSSASILTGNTLIEPRFLEGESVRQFDYVIAHPPVGVRLSSSELSHLERDRYHRFLYGTPRRMADLAFIQHIVASLSERGRAAVLVGLRTLFVSGREAQIRRAVIEDDIIEAVITLSGNLLPNTSAPTAILILNKSKPEELKDQILFVYANEEYESGDRKRNIISDQNRKRIVQAVERRQEQHRFAAIATLKEIEENDYVLMPASYIDLIGLNNFMGGDFQWIELGEVAEIFQGTRLGRQSGDAGVTPAIRGRDLSVAGLTVDDLAKVDVPSDLSNPLYSEAGDILIQRIGQNPKILLVEDELEGVLIRDTVYVIRFREKDSSIARYLVEFLNSNVGQALLSTGIGGAVIPTLRLTDLRHLRIPIPDKAVIELVNDLHKVEQTLIDRINHARDLRQRLFSIQDPDRVIPQLQSLNTEAQVLEASLVQVDDFDFQVRNFYPFPLAYAYRILSAIRDPAQWYQEQLRVAENILAFLGSVGLALAAHTHALSDPDNTNLTSAFLAKCWEGGISPGDWQSFGRHTGSILRSNRELAAVGSFASLWFRGSGRKESEFARATKELVELKNDFKHDRGPKTPYEYEQAIQRMEKSLCQCLERLAFFVQYPIRLVQHMDRDWQTKRAVLDTLVYVGDHPGLRREQLTLADMLSEDKLYLELTDEEWAPLYPLISVHYCPDCRFRETYFIDRWDGPGERVVLKSFERGHTHENDDAARVIDTHLQHWLRTRFSGASTT